MTQRFLILPLLLLVSAAAFAQSSNVAPVILADPTGDANETFQWSIDVINNGPANARNVIVTGSSEPSLGTRCAPQTIDIIYGGSHAVVQCTTGPLGVAGDVVLHAHVNPGNDDTRTIHMIAGGADIGLVVVAPKVDPGLPFEIVGGLYNNGKIAATGVTTTLSLPPLVRVVKLPDNCQASGQAVTCADDDVAAHSNGTAFRISLAADDALNGQTFFMTASVHTTAPEGNISDNRVVVETQVFREFYVTEANGDALAGAIGQANVNCRDGYPCKIAFRLSNPPAEGYFTIKPTAALPRITAPSLSIDGSTQTRLTGDTNPNGPEIFIDGSAIDGDGIVYDSPCSLDVGSLAVGHFGQAAVSVLGSLYRSCSTSGLFVHDNYLGVDPTGLQAAPNGRGIVANDVSYLSIKNNIISGNRRSGIWMGRTPYAFIMNNTIGLDRRLQPLGNGASGIYAGPLASDDDIRGNYIAFNHDFGVAIDRKALGIYIGPNSIFANSQPGIDVGLDGPTPDRDVPAPTVLSAQYDATTNKTLLTIASSEPLIITLPTLDIYASDAPHPSGYGDGQYYLGTVRFNSRDGNIHFAALGDWRGKWVSATVTRNQYLGFLRTEPPTPDVPYLETRSTTSEFSRAVKVE